MSIAALRRSVPRLSRSAVDRCSSSSNPAALAAFRRLMRARAALFMGDDFALGEARIKLREEFGAARDVTDPAQLGARPASRLGDPRPRADPPPSPRAQTS